jgi:ATP-binding cassette subfamily C (CFTR/MRP) protein 1
MFLAYFSSCLTPFLALVIFTVMSSQALGTSRACTALSLIKLLTQPLMDFITDNIMPLAGAVACFERVRIFLMADSRIDPRISGSETPETPPSSEKSEAQIADIQPTSDQINTKFESVENTINIAIDIHNGFFGWAADEPVLKDLNIKINRSVLTMIVGPVACGKSTLLKGLLGELPHSKGSVHFLHGGADSAIALRDQSPWLLNVSVRDKSVSRNMIPCGISQ